MCRGGCSVRNCAVGYPCGYRKCHPRASGRNFTGSMSSTSTRLSSIRPSVQGEAQKRSEQGKREEVGMHSRAQRTFDNDQLLCDAKSLSASQEVKILFCNSFASGFSLIE